MSEHDKHTAFLKALIQHQNAADCAGLQERMKQAQLNERAIKRSLVAVSVLGLLAGCGICYSAVLLPQFFQSGSHLIVKIFATVGLGSLICLVTFAGLWAHYRRLIRHLHDECRRLIMGTLRTPDASLLAPLSVAQESNTKVYRMETVTPAESSIVQLPKAS